MSQSMNSTVNPVSTMLRMKVILFSTFRWNSSPVMMDPRFDASELIPTAET